MKKTSKNVMLLILILLTLVILAVVLCSCDLIGNSQGLRFEYDDYNDTYYVVGIEADSLIDVKIPAKCNGKIVDSVVFTDEGWENARSISFSKNIKSITFYGTVNLSNLESITVDKDNENFYSENECVFRNVTYFCDDGVLRGKALVLGCKNSLLPTDGSLIEIEESAFSGSGLTNITIPNSVTRIGYSAFYNCSSLNSIVIPNSVTSIGFGLLNGCQNLKEISLPYVGSEMHNEHYSNFSSLFGFGSRVLPYGLKVSITGRTSIEEYAFSDCKGIINVIIGDDVFSIGENAFYKCKDLNSVTIGKSVTTIGNYAFSECPKLIEVYNLSNLNIMAASESNGYVAYHAKDVYTSIDTPSKITTTDNGYMFYVDDSVTYLIGFVGNQTELILPDSFNGKSYVINDHAFYRCEGLTSITIPNSVTTIGDYAFVACLALERVYYTGDIADWCNISFCDDYANPLMYANNWYIDNKLVTELIIPDTITEIKPYTFEFCISIKNVIIPDSVTSIGDRAFYDCISLTSITIPNSVTTVGDYAFEGCSSLTSITIPDSVTTISFSAFRSCSSLTSIIIPNSVTTIRGYAFTGCSKLTSITIPDSVTTIGECAFWSCSSLTNVTVPDSVTSIGDRAFHNCNRLTSVYFMGTVADWANINIGNNNGNLTNAMRYFYSETEPELNMDGTDYDGNYWHYVDEVVTIWKKEV